MDFRLSLLPVPQRLRDGRLWLWDSVRRKTLRFRPEEIVRQQLLLFLQLELGISPARIGVEVQRDEIRNRRAGRADVIVFAAESGAPELYVEVKAPGKDLDTATLKQLRRYRTSTSDAAWLLVNGDSVFYWSERNDEMPWPAPEALSIWQRLLASARGGPEAGKRPAPYHLGFTAAAEDNLSIVWLQLGALLSDLSIVGRVLTEAMLPFTEPSIRSLYFSSTLGWLSGPYLQLRGRNVNIALQPCLHPPKDMGIRCLLGQANSAPKMEFIALAEIAASGDEDKVLLEKLFWQVNRLL
jgi:hypothetical protein